MRFGLSPIADFGSSSIDIGGENGIPIRTNCLCPVHEPWSFTFNLEEEDHKYGSLLFSYVY